MLKTLLVTTTLSIALLGLGACSHKATTAEAGKTEQMAQKCGDGKECPMDKEKGSCPDCAKKDGCADCKKEEGKTESCPMHADHKEVKEHKHDDCKKCKSGKKHKHKGCAECKLEDKKEAKPEVKKDSKEQDKKAEATK